MKVRIQVIKVYDVDVPDDCHDPISYAYRLQTTEIERNGRFVDAMSDHAETDEEVEDNRKLLEP